MPWPVVLPASRAESTPVTLRQLHADFAGVVDQFNVSPKLANSGMAEEQRLKFEALRSLAATGKAWFKFVLTAPGDLVEIESMAARVPIDRDRILLMPEGRTVPELDETAAWLADLCRENGYRFSDRLHVRLWGDKRGV